MNLDKETHSLVESEILNSPSAVIDFDKSLNSETVIGEHVIAIDFLAPAETLKDAENIDAVTQSTELFENDKGELSLETRKVLVQLLSGPSIEGRRQNKSWKILLRDEAAIRTRLSEVFLDLVIDREHEYAFTRQADSGALELPSLLRRIQLNFLDTALMIYLRQRLAQADSISDRPVLDRDEILEHLQLYKKSASTDHSGFTNKARASIERFKKNRLLLPISGSPNRFEVSPTLKLLFSADEIQAVTKLYKNVLNGESSAKLSEESIQGDEE